MMKKITVLVLGLVAFIHVAQSQTLQATAKVAGDKIEQKVIDWRRDFHQNPELGNSETRTAAIIAKHLKALGIEVKTGVAKTGVVGFLKGGLPGPTIALRADMDALPVEERNDLPFKSVVKTKYNGNDVSVMHACGHDAHTAMLMGVAEVLAGMKSQLKGNVKFIFQPAEEGAPVGEEGGAQLMVKEGVMDNVNVIFGCHVQASLPSGTIGYHSGGFMAGVSDMKITVKGKGTHGASPWMGIDPIVVAAQIINNLQTIVSRNLDVTQNPGVVTIGSIHGGNRSNIISEKVEMLGTMRTFSDADEKMIADKIKLIVNNTAEANGTTAEVLLPYSSHYPVTYNDPALTQKMIPSLQKAAGDKKAVVISATTGAEDFSFYQQKVPGLFFNLGVMPEGKAPTSHHTPDFFVDETAFKIGVNAFTNLVLDYMDMTPEKKVESQKK
jgi:amidohydrolase